MSRSRALALFCLAAASLAVPAAAHAAPAGLLSQALRSSREVGAAPASTARSVSLVLASRDPQGLRRFLADAAHAQLTPSAYAARFGPSDAAVTAVRTWASSAGLAVSSVSANRSVVKLTAPTATLGKALGVSFRRFDPAKGHSYVASIGTATLPARVSAVTSAVVGLSDAAHLTTPNAAPEASSIGISTYGPKELADLYGAGTSNDGSGQSVSIITAGDLDGPRKDLVTFENQFGLPHVPWEQTTVGAPSSDTSGSDEWDLDSQYSTGLAPGVSALHVYVGNSLADADIIDTINRWVTDKKSTQASFSAGECETLAELTGFRAGLDTILAQAAAQGQTLFTSSGDTGSQCPLPVVGLNGVPAGLPGTNFPAASPSAIGVGGTTVLGAGPNEIAWYAGGGGTSLFETAPAFQSHAGGSFLGVARGVPDVALDADPTSGYRVIVDGAEETIGGTSASAPAWQGIWTRDQAAHGGTLGFAGPKLYAAPASAFNDITLGTNVLFAATPGYDYTTGLGTPKIAALVAAG